ncbi:MAG: methyltransferase, partial [Clostridia bacterium]|nr:methyltransferase [Clostridia bacterium]
MSARMQMGELISLALEMGVLRKAVFSKPVDPQTQRAVLTLRTVGGRVVGQVETLRADNKALHENIGTEDVERLTEIVTAFGQVNLMTTAGDCELRCSKSGKCTLLGGDKLRRGLESGNGKRVEPVANNRKKEYILDGNEPFLRLLDVSDANGRVRDKKQSKFRQINRFLELIRDCLEHLPREGELRICDLCCGKSYLSFAAYHYF